MTTPNTMVLGARKKKLRVLCLHGHRTNDKVMLNQTKGLRAALGDDAEFIFLNAPNLARGPTDPVIEKYHAADAPFYEWWTMRPVNEHDNLPMEDTEWIFIHEHVGDTLEFMERKLKELAPIDVVVGFSQGAVLLTVLSMKYLQAKKERPWKLCVCVGGVRVRAVNHQREFQGPDGKDFLVPYPSIHIIGETDPFYDASVGLTCMYDDFPTVYPQSTLKKRVFYHKGGHKFPSVKKHEQLYEEVASLIKDHCRACDEPTSRL